MFEVGHIKISVFSLLVSPTPVTDTEKLISREALPILPTIAFYVNILLCIFIESRRCIASGNTAELADHARHLYD